MDINLDLDVLKIFKSKANWDKYGSLLRKETLSETAQLILDGYLEYFSRENKDIVFSEFAPWWFNTLHKNFDEDSTIYYKSIFSNIDKLDNKSVLSTVTRFRQEQLWCDLIDIKNTSFNVKEMIERLQAGEKEIHDHKPGLNYLSWDDAMAHEELEDGWAWSMRLLNESWGSIRPGQLYMIVATTHTGKSSFVTSEAVNVMRQLAKTSKSVLYFNNERSEKAVFERFVTGLYNVPVERVRQRRDKALKRLKQDFPSEPLKIFSARDGKKSMKDIEAACALYNPGFVIIDQLDKLVDTKDSLSRRPYEHVYSWARNLAVKYNTPVFGVTQYGVQTNQNGDVVNKPMTQFGTFDAKVDKAANTDYLLGIQNVENAPNLRKLYLIRAKEGQEGLNFTCKFNRTTGIYSEL